MTSAPGAPVVVTGGGTAGHVLPALAIARALVAGGRRADSVWYVGSQRGMEARLVGAAGFRLTLLPGRGIPRRISAESAAAALSLAGACAAGIALVRRLRPAAVVTVGGYAGLPAALGALLWRVPLVVVNVDAVPGAANRLVAPFAAASAVALAGTPLPRAVVTGAPVREEVLAVDRAPAGRFAARAALGLPQDAPVLAVTGGSLGAGRLNEAVLGLLAAWRGPADLVVYHVAGERNRAAVAAAAPATALDYRVVGYEERLPELLAAADVVVCRAGASTVAELGVIGTPAILVPLPGAPGDHQHRNAERLAAAGAAVLLADAAASGTRLAEEVAALLADPVRRAEMEQNARRLGRRDAASAVARLVEEVARRGQLRDRTADAPGATPAVPR